MWVDISPDDDAVDEEDHRGEEDEGPQLLVLERVVAPLALPDVMGGSSSSSGAVSIAPVSEVASAPHLPASMRDFTITDEDGQRIGVIKADLKRQQFNAHCCQLGQLGARRDHRTPTMPECRMNRVGKKQPLGFLVQWLRQGAAYIDRKDHKDSAMIISFDDRKECRLWLQGRGEMCDLLRYEAEWSGVAWAGPDSVQEV